MKNITSANTEIYQMLEFCDKGFKDSIMTVLHKAITKKTKLQNISKKKIIDIREKMEIIELKNLTPSPSPTPGVHSDSCPSSQ